MIEHSQKSVKQTIDRKEGIRQGDPTNHRAGNIPLIPLIPGEIGNHHQIAVEDGMKPIDPLAAAAVHFMRHGGRTSLPFGKAFAKQFMPGHNAEGGGKICRSCSQADQ